MTISTHEIRSTVRRIKREGIVDDDSSIGPDLIRAMELDDKAVDKLWAVLEPDETLSQLDHEAIARRVVRGDDDDGTTGVLAKL
jgi:hypothetical protein